MFLHEYFMHIYTLVKAFITQLIFLSNGLNPSSGSIKL